MKNVDHSIKSCSIENLIDFSATGEQHENYFSRVECVSV